MQLRHWEHQSKFLSRIRARDAWGLFWEMGTGKTFATISAILQKQEREGRNLKVLVLCPPVVITNWEREIYKYSRGELIPLPLIGSVADRARSLAPLAKEQRSGVAITNYEAITNQKFFDVVAEWKPDLVVFDEAQKLKTPTSKRSKAAFALAKMTKYRFALTGTPILNTPMDIFGVYRVIDLGESFGDNFFSFRLRYFYDRNSGMPKHKYFPKWTMRSDMEKELKENIGRAANFISKTECLDLPPLVKQRIDIALSEEQLKAYTEMREAFIAFVRDGSGSHVATAATALTKALRMQQIVSGHLKVGETEEDEKVITFEDNPRRKALEELLDEYAGRHKIIVWAAFRHDYKVIASVCNKLKLGCVELHGETSPTMRTKAIDLFTHDPNCRVLVGNGLSAGVGINLVVSDISVYYSRSFSLEADMQSEARNWRGGSEIHQKITRIDFVTPATIDEICFEALQAKKSLSDNILELVKYI